MLYAALRGRPGAPAYVHLPAHQEPLLWSADALAWAYGAGGDWRRRVDPLLDMAVVLESERRETRPPTVRRRAGFTSGS